MANGAAAGVFIGRERELATLRGLVDAAAAGRGQVVLLEGEAGIGKTRLVREALGHASARGLEIREGDCDDAASTRPFAAIAQALHLALDDWVDASDSSLASAGTEFRVVEMIGAVVEQIASANPMVLVLEDLHWADSSTLVALRSVVRRARQLPVVIVGTSRSGYERADLNRVTDDLLRDGGTRIALGPLGAQEVASLAGQLLGDEPSSALMERLEGATGNPLFVTEYLGALVEADAIDEGIPVEFRLTVLRRLGHLSDATSAVLRTASVLGASFAASDLAIVLDEKPSELAASLQQAIGAGVIGQRGERLAFRHDLVRDAIYQHIPLDLRRQLHRQAGASLASAGAGPLVVAHHLALAAESYDREAADWLRRAAREAAARAPGVAVELLERARDLLSPSAADRDGLLAEMVMPLAWAGRLAEAETLSLELLARKPAPAVAGALRCGLVYALIWQGRPREALRYTEVGPDEQLNESDRVLLLAEAAVASLFAFDMRAGATQAAAAAEAARGIGHDLALCHALCVQAWVAGFAGQPRAAIDIGTQAIDLADRSPTGEPHLANPRFFPGMSLVVLDRLDEARDVLQRGRRISEEMGLVWSLPLYHSHIGASRFVAGDWDAAMAEFEACLAIADEVGTHSLVVTAASAWRSVIQVHRDELEAAEETQRAALRRLIDNGAPVGFGLLNWARAVLAEARGDLDEALGLLQPAWEQFYVAGANTSDPWSVMALVRMLVKAGNVERAAEILPFVDQTRDNVGTESLRGQALRCRGLVENDVELLMEAVDAYRASPRPLELAATCEEAGLHLIDAGRAAEATAYLDDAIELYEDLGALRDVGRVRGELRARGVVRGRRGRHARASTGWGSLTATELKVVALVAQRMSNPEVAERLFISRHTVESHLKSVYRKLSIASRIELAAEAARHNP